MVLFFKFFNNVIDENNLANSTCLNFIEIVIKVVILVKQQQQQ